MTALAALPFALVIVALLTRRSSLVTSVIGVGSAVVVCALWFPVTSVEVLTGVRDWWVLLVEILLIIAGGIAFAEVGKRTGALTSISEWLRRVLGTGVAPALAIAHGLTPLAEALTGYGIGVAIAVPLLVAIGYTSRQSVIIGLLGLCAVPWGAMGPGTMIAAQHAGLSFDELGVASAVFNLPVVLAAGLVAALCVTPRAHGLRAQTLAAAAGLASGLALWAGVLGANLAFGMPPAGALGAAIVLALHLVLRRLRGAGLSMQRTVTRALLPYGVLLAGVVAASFVVRMLDATDSPSRVVASPALWLWIATVVASLMQRGTFTPAFRNTARIWVHVGPATALFVVMGVIMSISGMSGQLAASLATLDTGYLLVTPVIAAAGGFLTGSNSGANAMFGAPQALTAHATGANVLHLMAVHNVAASMGTMAFLARIELAARLCDDPPERAPILRVMLITVGTVVAILGVALWLSG